MNGYFFVRDRARSSECRDAVVASATVCEFLRKNRRRCVIAVACIARPALCVAKQMQLSTREFEARGELCQRKKRWSERGATRPRENRRRRRRASSCAKRSTMCARESTARARRSRRSPSDCPRLGAPGSRFRRKEGRRRQRAARLGVARDVRRPNGRARFVAR
jgi:hypothetical protein